MIYIPIIFLSILAIVLIFLIASKFEDHFRYFKILLPDRLNRYGSIIDTWSNLSFDILDIKIACFLPYFSSRRIDLENNNNKLKRLAEKIQRTCKWILIIGAIFIISLITFLLFITKHNSSFS